MNICAQTVFPNDSYKGDSVTLLYWAEEAHKRNGG